YPAATACVPHRHPPRLRRRPTTQPRKIRHRRVALPSTSAILFGSRLRHCSPKVQLALDFCGALSLEHPMIERVLNFYAVIFARPLFRQWNLFLLAMGLRGIGVLNYKTPYLSGEDAVVAHIVRELDDRAAIVLDIGANEGDFTDFV